MAYKVYVDGQEGTTGLKIHERLAGRADIEVLRIDADKRRDISERAKLLNEADVAILCLPDDAAREAASLVTNSHTRVIDASTAHRVADGWVYGLPELSPDQRGRIEESKRVSVPGCYATGFAMIVYPLVSLGIIAPDYPVTCHAVSGYSGGGRKLITAFEDPANAEEFHSPSLYALALTHKHVPEMQKISGLSRPPIFTPIVANFHQGMTVSIPLYPELLKKPLGAPALREVLAERYEGCRFVRVMPEDAVAKLDMGFLNAEGLNETNMIELYVGGSDERAVAVARLDNLGKGSSGAAVQNMNIMLGIDEGTGLE